jgi:uncharacterized protein YqfA (UPF0365 family)
MTEGYTALAVLMTALFATVAGVALYIYYGRLIMRSRVVGAPVSFKKMVRMTLRGLDANAVVIAYLDAHTAGVSVTLERLEAVASEQGDPRAAVKELIAAKAAGTHASSKDVGLGRSTAT